MSHHASPASLAPSASHMRCSGSWGGMRLPATPAAPQPTVLAAEIWQHAALCLRAPTNHSPLIEPLGTEGKSAGNHLLCGEFCGTERAAGFLHSHNDLLVCWWQLSLLKLCILLLSSAPTQAAPPHPSAPALPRSTSRGFLGKLSTSTIAGIPVTDHKGQPSRPCTARSPPAAPSSTVSTEGARGGGEDRGWGSRDL